ncbi:acetylornithine deacetylase/succinyl-diaminopimelate desuccinylase [Humitalea rosea]|uniref:Acetylornithine deacetylase/succinyl-diaminopimelate desuccinylase n=1 Tax=Humitalea rosea TaxID=990373 RepID=A0A2W7IJ37_9PROT|nr:M20/M25/M40 family metallo-hydrolase [Humitalea rosea]PZW46663.1 acetylornithine deacetylase/succinyl-diaminopimelate desuccinylase [Humitalea rosea]
MTDTDAVAGLAAELVRIDSRSSLSNIPVADRLEAELAGFAIERLDYTDARGVQKRVLVAHRGGPGGLALSGHMDTVPDTGWTDDPWSGRIADGVLHGLGSVDMKGPVAAAIIAARGLPADVPVTLLLTTDEETTKEGARAIVTRSVLAREAKLAGIIVVEPTGLIPIRGHRSSINFVAVAEGVQAHSSMGVGRNANWALIPFLAEMKPIHEMLRDDPAWHDAGYDPVFSDFNIVIENHGAAVNVTVPLATARIKFRYSRGIDPTAIVEAVRAAAARTGVTLTEAREGTPPDLPAAHPLIQAAVKATGHDATTVPFGTDASELSALAPCVILGPGTTATAHTPREEVVLAELGAAVPLFRQMLTTGV